MPKEEKKRVERKRKRVGKANNTHHPNANQFPHGQLLQHPESQIGRKPANHIECRALVFF
jgi:hypothetical protein